MAEIEFDDVVKRYPDGFEAVKHMNLEIRDAEFMILVGPSGCGKSTALRMIAGLEDISEGDLKIGGEVVNDLAPKDRDIAMVFQNYALYPHMTVEENIAFGLRRHGFPRREFADARCRCPPPQVPGRHPAPIRARRARSCRRSRGPQCLPAPHPARLCPRSAAAREQGRNWAPNPGRNWWLWVHELRPAPHSYCHQRSSPRVTAPHSALRAQTNRHSPPQSPVARRDDPASPHPDLYP